MQIEEFALGSSFIHRLDPRVKIGVAVTFSVAVALTQSVHAAAAGMVFSLSLILAAGISLSRVLSRLALVNLFIVFLWFFLPFTVPGQTAFSVGPLTGTWEGLHQAALIALKGNTIVLADIALLGTSPIFTLVHALSHMGVPEKLVHLFFFCFRYIHVIHEEYHRLANAMKMRGFKPRTDLHTYRNYAYLVGMLLVRSFDRSARILAAMRCRGFRGRFYILHHYEMKRCDYLMGVSGLVILALLVVVP